MELSVNVVIVVLYTGGPDRKFTYVEEKGSCVL